MEHLRAPIYHAVPRQSGYGWESPLWEDFLDPDLDEEEPPFDADFDDLAKNK